MPKVIKNRFDGGVYDPRDTISNGFSSVRHYMLGKTKLTPYRDMETETLNTGTIAANKPSDVVKGVVMNGATPVPGIFGLGQVGAGDTNPKFYVKADTTVTSTFNALSNGEGSGLGTVVRNSLIIYKGHLYCLVNDGTNVKLIKHVYGASTASVGTVGPSPTFSISLPIKMFIHPKDNKLYMFSGYTMAVWDGSSLATRAFGEDYNISSICPYGNNIKMAMVAKDETHSVTGVWSGSTTSSELVDVVTWGNDCLLVLENIGDTVVGISSVSVGGAADLTTLGTRSVITVRQYTGGTPTIVQRIESPQGARLLAFKGKRNDSLYFVMSAYLNGTAVYQVWTIYKNEAGQFVVAPDRKVNNDTEIVNEDFFGLSVVGDYMWVAFTGYFLRTNNDANYTATSSFETLVNPGMDVGDRSAKKQLKAVSLRYGSPTGASHTVTLSYSVDGGAFTPIFSKTGTGEVTVTEETGLAVAPNIGKNFLEGREYVFKVESTGYCEIYELKYGYEVIKTNI